MKKITNIRSKALSFTMSLLFLACSFSNLKAQSIIPFDSKNIIHQIHIGFPTTFFDSPELGFYGAYNPSYLLNNYFSLEGQIAGSYSKFEHSDDFFSATAGTKIVANSMAGLRAYILPAKFDFRIYASVMGGMQYVQRQYIGSERVDQNEILPAAALGLYLEYKNFTAGLAVEGDDHMILKAGYRL